jgi:FRG domain/Domain of unknown function (DUF3387)
MSPSEIMDEVPEWGQFRVLSHTASGRVPVTRVRSWQHLTQVLEDAYFKRPKTQLVFRGQRRYDWTLSPSLGRLDARGIVSEGVAAEQLQFFRRAVRGRLADRSLVDIGEEDELWAVGQHHGLYTPLIDWTHSPYVALFFAFEQDDPKAEAENPFRALYVLNKTHVEAEDRCPDVRILEPRKDDHGRLVNQAGLFTLSAYGNTLENSLIDSLHEEVLEDVDEGEEEQVLARYLCKIYIPNEDREGCLRHLRWMNVHHASLFPDLIGAASYCNAVVADNKRAADIESAAAALAEPAAAQPVAVAVEVQTPQLTPGTNLLGLLTVWAGAEFDQGRLALIADELALEIERNKVVDWEKREAVHARLRNISRVVLRKYGYPPDAREVVVDHVLQSVITEPAQETVPAPAVAAPTAEEISREAG